MASAVVAGGPVVVTAADMVAGHVSLDISCLDRLYLIGFLPKLQTPGGVIYFLHDHRGNPITSPALFEQIGNRFRGAMRQWVQANNIPMVAVGAVLADGPPHRSRRAELPHRAPASGPDDEAHVRVGMHHADCG